MTAGEDSLIALLSRVRFDSNRLILNVDGLPDSLQEPLLPRHLHDSWEFKIMLSGHRKLYRPDKGLVRMRAPCVQILAPQVTHYTDGPHTISTDCVYLNCCFENSAVWIAQVRHDWRDGVFLLPQQRARWQAKLHEQPELFAARIATCLQVKTTQENRVAAGWLQVFFATLASTLNEKDSVEDRGESAGLSRIALAYIEQRYYDVTLSVKDVATYVRVTPNHLAYLFRRTFGTTVRQAIVRTRLKRARRLLETGRYSVKETARLTGWKTQFYLSNCYKTYFGHTPSESRTSGGMQNPPCSVT